MLGEGCSLASSTAAATENRKVQERKVASGLAKPNTDTKNNLAYGELGFMGVAVILEQMRLACKELREGGIFVDIGSGSGKCCIAAALLHDFSVVRGIEIAAPLHKLAVEQVAPRYREMAGGEGKTEVHFQCGDLTKPEVNWDDADLVLCNCAVFGEELMGELCKKTLNMKKGALFATSTRTLMPEICDGVWEPVCAFKVNMMFGLISAASGGDDDTITSEDVVYLHRKTA